MSIDRTGEAFHNAHVYQIITLCNLKCLAIWSIPPQSREQEEGAHVKRRKEEHGFRLHSDGERCAEDGCVCRRSDAAGNVDRDATVLCGRWDVLLTNTRRGGDFPVWRTIRKQLPEPRATGSTQREESRAGNGHSRPARAATPAPASPPQGGGPQPSGFQGPVLL